MTVSLGFAIVVFLWLISLVIPIQKFFIGSWQDVQILVVIVAAFVLLAIIFDQIKGRQGFDRPRSLKGRQFLLFSLGLIIISSLYLGLISSYISGWTTDFLTNIMIIIGGAGGGLFVALVASMYEARRRSQRKYEEIIFYLGELSTHIYVNIKYGNSPCDSSSDTFLNGLKKCRVRDKHGQIKDMNGYLKQIRSLLFDQANKMEEKEIYPSPFKPKIIYDVKHLTYAYSDAMPDALYENIEKELNHARRIGWEFLASSEGYGDISRYSLTRDQLFQINHFIEVNEKLYEIIYSDLKRKQSFP